MGSTDSYNSITKPFFCVDPCKSELTYKRKFNTIDENNEIDLMLNTEYFVQLPTILKELYQLVSGVDKELYINKWVFMGLKDVYDRYKNFYKDQNIYIIDIAFCYIGMGW